MRNSALFQSIYVKCQQNLDDGGENIRD